MDDKTPGRIKMGMAAVIVAAVVIIILNAYSRGTL